MAVRNRILASLPPDVLAELSPALQRVGLKQRDILQEANRPIEHVYFIESGVASLFARTKRDGPTEAAMIGRLGMVGIPVLLGTMRSPHRCLMQVSGEGLRIRAEDLRAAVDESAELRQRLFDFVHVLLVQNAQNVLCNARHELGDRLARWLLQAEERLDAPHIPITHVLLSTTLGVRRAGITAALANLEQAGALRRARGAVEILDRAVLEQKSCECYRIVRAEYERLIGSVAM
jgi:CRP-like cAMP-binding protein